MAVACVAGVGRDLGAQGEGRRTKGRGGEEEGKGREGGERARKPHRVAPNGKREVGGAVIESESTRGQ